MISIQAIIEVIIMKRFLYYDEDSINSFLAQIECGLTTQNTDEDSETNTATSSNLHKESITGDISAKIVGLGSEINGNKEDSNTNSDASSKIVRGIQEKILHDYAFEKVCDYMSKRKLIVSNPKSIGDVISINGSLTFLDFDFFQKLFADDGVVKYSEEQNKVSTNKKLAEIENQMKTSNIPQSQKIQLKQQITELKTALKNADDERKDVQKTIDVLKKTIPYNHSIITDKYLIACDDNKFRDDPNIVAFKYGGNLCVLGYITNIITKDESKSASDNKFAGLYNSLNTVMLSIFENKDEVFIVHPIAIYY